ncbi:MAG: elongation factor G, partial [Candidatus Kapaibacterium sp.]
LLFESGTISRRGSVEQGNTVSDHTDIERAKGASMFTTICNLDWRTYKINLLDTPGYEDFMGETIAALRASDTGLLVLNATCGVEVGTEIIWRTAEEFRTLMIIAVNRIDSEQSDYERTLAQAKESFGRGVTAIQFPLNEGPACRRFVDVLSMTMYEYGDDGGKPAKHPIPEECMHQAQRLHRELVEAVAENDETLMERYIGHGGLSEDELSAGLKAAMISRSLFPVFCVSALRNMGGGRLLGIIDQHAPGAHEIHRPVVDQSGNAVPCDPSAKPLVFVFKAVSEPSLGEMSYIKIYAGTVRTGEVLVNEQTGVTENLGHLFVVDGRKREEVPFLVAGDIGAVVKLKNTHVGDTLHEKGYHQSLPPLRFPAPKIRVAAQAMRKGEEEKVGNALHHVHEEDPTLIVEHSQELKQTLLHAQGEMHLAAAKWRLAHRYAVEVEFVPPRIPYRETITRAARGMIRHKKQSGGAGQFAEVHLLLEPYSEGMADSPGVSVRGSETTELPWGGVLVFVSGIVGGVIDARFMPAILKGVMEKLASGVLTGSPVRDLRVTVIDGKMHPVDSNEAAFKTAGMMAFHEAFLQASPSVLEPVYDVEVTVPEESVGDVLSDLPTRRAVIFGVEGDGHQQTVQARLPLAELDRYAVALRSMTHGRGLSTSRFAEYAVVPPDIRTGLVDAFAST